MYKIGIDLNNLLRDYNRKFVEEYDKEFGTFHNLDKRHTRRWLDNIDPQHCKKVVPFESNARYFEFSDVDYPQELCAFAGKKSRFVSGELTNWMNNYVIEHGAGNVEIVIISTGELDNAAMASMFFITKGIKVRHVLIHGKKRVWEECDAIVTANPKLIKARPAGKKVVKIDRKFNKNTYCDAHYHNLHEMFLDGHLFEKLGIEQND